MFLVDANSLFSVAFLWLNPHAHLSLALSKVMTQRVLLNSCLKKKKKKKEQLAIQLSLSARFLYEYVMNLIFSAFLKIKQCDIKKIK